MDSFKKCNCHGKRKRDDKKPSINYLPLIVLIISIVIMIYYSYYKIKWDAAVIFTKPDKTDINLPAAINVKDINNTMWKERLYYYELASKEGCSHGYQTIINKNLKILGISVTESFIFLCKHNISIVNFNIHKTRLKNLQKLQCNDTYGTLNRLSLRSHPLNYSWYNKNGIQIFNMTQFYKDTCMLYNSYDLIKSNWY